MAIIGLQGIRGGTGTTSITAALAWALRQLGESVLVVDASSDNMLRLFFDIAVNRPEGWARATLDNQNWQESAWRYTSSLDILPFGTLNESEKTSLYTDSILRNKFNQYLKILKDSQRYKWILVDLPFLPAGITTDWFAQLDYKINIAQPDANCHTRLCQQPIDSQSFLLVNGLQVASKLQNDIYQVWCYIQQAIIPVAFHADEAMAESLAMKKPVGEYSPHSLIAEEMITLANWCLINLAGQRV
ncbi:cellulose biosynthesis protein BcsQ [Klebsiella sp. BIGb0407]|uniref:cellulose biosynthesis protein BcsQ n=1 Tax=Klebsiella sp. BIGb0407 TaxID=2940603 RepID=UPI002166DE5B|nr:cellulose biosynthesis protein BcsQ [Klebsiella sp. BIGb0407]MCS3431276.1 cellulose synthase operon protein YhjQ [Klebsiella sp. BIGb0407]